ncbi:hypothetical protein IFM89_035243 [Coptis chinensis]|uniref:ARM repeat superfamily protein n=1 Tax=Coptis chinensis TaxID=261450 RepID=A0A835IHS8_9MAGN|nr:hypothetical protein IFM89_035243 [Coptis chinensis]
MEEQIKKSDSTSIFSSNLGRVINTLLTSRPRKLETTISNLGSNSQQQTSLEEALCFLRNYISDVAKKGENLDQILVPMIENSLKSKESKHGNQVLVLLKWLFRDEIVFRTLANNLAEIIRRKDDRYIMLGWCTLVCGLVDYETTTSQYKITGTQEKDRILLQILFSSISHLLFVLCSGSVVQDGFELPTRIAVAAADCILVLTERSIIGTNTSRISNPKTESSEQDLPNYVGNLSSSPSVGKKVKSASRLLQGSENMEMEVLLWDHLDDLITLVQRLMAWSRKSRPLHGKGLEQVQKWLEGIKGHCGSIRVKAGGSILTTGLSLLSSCWKHYSMLLRLVDHRFSQQYLAMLNQYISGIEFYMNEYSNQHSGAIDDGMETRKFFLISISLLLGRLDNKQFETAMSEHGLQVSRLLLTQLQCVDGDVIEVAVDILRATIFKTNSFVTNSLINTQQLETVFPLLLSLLDERDSTSKAIVMLTAEYCSRNKDGQCLHEVFKRLAAENLLQRRNAIDVISEVIHFSSDSRNSLSLSMRQDLAQKLLDRLADGEPAIRVQASNLLSTFDPSVVVPELVCLVYSSIDRVRIAAGDTLVAVLKCHNQNPDAIIMLIDCLSKLCQGPENPNPAGREVKGSVSDSDRLLRLIPQWSKTVQNWNIYIEPLVDKMFTEPSNAVIVRFLSYISDNLAEAQDVVLHHVLLYMQGQKQGNEMLLSGGASGTFMCVEFDKSKDCLFDRLCPLLIIKLLPFRVFNDLNSTVMYGQLIVQGSLHDEGDNAGSNCISSSLVTRAFNKFEFEDVRKLAAELCGRIHPQVSIFHWHRELPCVPSFSPLPRSAKCLSHAAHATVIKVWRARRATGKECRKTPSRRIWLLRSMSRGSDSACHPDMLEIRKIIEMVLLWPSLDSDEVSKAQHGCIDCLALMVCTELQAPDLSEDCSRNNFSISREKRANGCAFSRNSVLRYVIENLTRNRNEFNSSANFAAQSHIMREFSDVGCESKGSIPYSFHLCMANVLISACQKISNPGKKPLAERILPVLIHSIEGMKDSEIRAACLQVLFSAVFHLKSAILPYSYDLLKLSSKALKKGSYKEKMASVKLMASIMASEDVVIGTISGGLLEARSVLSNIASTDPSMELREVCKKLLVCITFPMDSIHS